MHSSEAELGKPGRQAGFDIEISDVLLDVWSQSEKDDYLIHLNFDGLKKEIDTEREWVVDNSESFFKWSLTKQDFGGL